MYSRTSFIYKYETSTLTPFVKPSNILNIAIQNVFYVQSYVESAFMYNPRSTNKIIDRRTRTMFRKYLICLKARQQNKPIRSLKIVKILCLTSIPKRIDLNKKKRIKWLSTTNLLNVSLHCELGIPCQRELFRI